MKRPLVVIFTVALLFWLGASCAGDAGKHEESAGGAAGESASGGMPGEHMGSENGGSMGEMHEGHQGQATSATCDLHGGIASNTPGGNFETVFGTDGIRVYLYTDQASPAMVEGATGSAIVTVPGGQAQEVPLSMQVPKESEEIVYFCPMHPEVVQKTPGECAQCGGMVLYKQNYLYGETDLSHAASGPVTAQIQVRKVSGGPREASFTVSYEAPKD